MKLEVLRRYRAQLEEVVRMDLVRLRQALHDAEARSRGLDEQVKLTAESYPAKVDGGVALDEFLVRQSRATAEMSDLAAARQAEGRLREAWNQKQDELLEAMQDRRTLDRLVQRIRQQQRQMQHKVDQMEMDEAARRAGVM
jgi:flagellar export protein FliJ